MTIANNNNILDKNAGAFYGSGALKSLMIEQIHSQAIEAEALRVEPHAVRLGLHKISNIANTYNLPRELCSVLMAIFNTLPQEQSLGFIFEFFGSIEPGQDLSKVWHFFAEWLLIDSDHGVVKLVENPAIAKVAHLCAETAQGGTVDDSEWLSASCSAWQAEDVAGGYDGYALAAAKYVATAYADFRYAGSAATAALNAAVMIQSWGIGESQERNCLRYATATAQRDKILALVC